jgi:hypothetical protein
MDEIGAWGGGKTFLVAGKGGHGGGQISPARGALLGRLGYHQTGVCLTPGFCWSAWILVTRCAESEVAAGWVGEIHRERVQRLPYPLAITRHILLTMRRCPFNSAFDDREDDEEPLSLCRAVRVLGGDHAGLVRNHVYRHTLRTSYSPLAEDTSVGATWSQGT